MFYKQNGIVAGILLLILFAGAIGLVSVQMDKTVNRMHYSVVEEMGEYRTELIRQDFQKTAELVESMQDYLATRGYQKEQFEELIALLIRQDNKVSRIWFEFVPIPVYGRVKPDLQRKEMEGCMPKIPLITGRYTGGRGRWHWGSISLWIIYMLIFQTYYLRGRIMLIS